LLLNFVLLLFLQNDAVLIDNNNNDIRSTLHSMYRSGRTSISMIITMAVTVYCTVVWVYIKRCRSSLQDKTKQQTDAGYHYRYKKMIQNSTREREVV
jgi:hypothetical protein